MISQLSLNKLQQVKSILVDDCENVLVSGRLIIDDIIRSHELIKVYGRKAISQRCMMKIDMQKAYNSTE